MLKHADGGRQRGGGFSLIEVLAALVIFSVAIVALVESFGASTAIQADLIEHSRALMLAENVLEEIRAANRFETGRRGGPFDGIDAGFEWESQISATDMEGLYRVSVRVVWRDRGEAELTSLMAERITPIME